MWVRHLLMRPLGVVSKDFEWTCELCETPPTPEIKAGEPTGRRSTPNFTWTRWRIRKDARWNDGTPITGADFRLAWEISIATPRPGRAEASWRGVVDVEIDPKSPDTFVTKIRGVSRQLPRWVWPVPSHLEGKTWTNAGGNWDSYLGMSAYTLAPNTPGLWNGPMMIATKSSDGLLLQAAPGGGKMPPMLLKSWEREEPLATAVVAGLVDLVPEGQLNEEAAAPLTSKLSTPGAQVRMIRARGPTWEHLEFNMRNPLLIEPGVRQAVAALVDAADLARQITGDAGQASRTFLLPGDPALALLQTPEWAAKAKTSGTERAKQILQESGWVHDGVWKKDGKELSFALAWPRHDPARGKLAPMLAEKLSAFGIKLTLQPEAPETFFSDLLRKARYTGLVLYAWLLTPGELPAAAIHSRELPTVQNNYRGQNHNGWVSRMVDEAIDQSPQAEGRAAAAALRAKAAQAWLNEVPGIGLWWRHDLAVIPQRLQGFPTEDFVTPTSRSVTSWHLSP